MPRKRVSLADRRRALAQTRAELEHELEELLREEKYLARQVARAREQIQYYEQLLGELKSAWGRRTPLAEYARRME
jgi:predicted  nucleic acid-binding Zn-ribbon protein